MWPLTSESDPLRDSAGGLVLPALSPVVKDNIGEAVSPTSEVTAEVLCPLDRKIYQDLSSEVKSAWTVM